MKSPTWDERWPLRLEPCRGELFSSWLVRLARCYEMPVETFCRAVWPEREVWCADIDRQIDDEALQLLSRKTGVSYPDLFSLTLRAHEQDTGTAPDEESIRDLYFRSGMSDYAIRFCPICLCGSPLYFRREWRLAFVTVCPRHRQLLLEQCEACKAPCLFTKLDLQYPLGCCHYCHRHLTLAIKEAPKEATLQIELHVAFQQNVLAVLRRPKIPTTGPLPSGK